MEELFQEEPNNLIKKNVSKLEVLFSSISSTKKLINKQYNENKDSRQKLSKLSLNIENHLDSF